MDELRCPIDDCLGYVSKVSIETYVEAMYLDEDGEIAESEEDERERIDCNLDHYYCDADDTHRWATHQALERAVEEAA